MPRFDPEDQPGRFRQCFRQVNIPSALDTAIAVVNPDGTTISGGGGGGTVNQGSPNTDANAWPVRITDGTHDVSVTAAGALKVDGSATTQPISGTVTQGNQGTIGQSWFVELTNGTNPVGTLAVPLRVDPTGTTTQPVSGTVSVGNFPATTTVVQASGANLHVNVDNFPATQPISGTVTANQGTPNSLANGWPVEVTDGTNILGTSTHPIRNDPTGTTTQPVSGTVTANAGTGNFTVVQSAGTNLHVNVDSAPTTAVTQSGTWTVQPGNTPNTSPWLTTINQGGNSATVTASNALKVDGSAVTQPVSGTVTANIGTTNGLALDATVSALEVSQGSTTSGQKGILGLGAVTTATPTYTTAQTSPLSLTTGGLLRVDASGAGITANQGTTHINGASLNLHQTENHITTNTTTTVVASTAYISCIAITITAAGTLSTLTIQDGQGTPVILVNASPTTATTTTPTILNFQNPILMTTGFSIVTTGTSAATVNVWTAYWN